MKLPSFLLFLLIISQLFSLGCYIVNAYKFLKCDFATPYKGEVLYGVGLVSPTFIVTCWMDLDSPSQ